MIMLILFLRHRGNRHFIFISSSYPRSSQKFPQVMIIIYIKKKQHKEQYLIITKTCLYNFDPLKPHFYIVKLGFTGVYIVSLFLLKNIDCEYSLEPPRRGGSNEYPQSMFLAEIWKKYQSFYLKIFSFWRWNFLYIWIGVFS